MIPKKIHYCWYGPNEMSPLMKKCLKSWEEKLPGYEIKRWHEGNSPMHLPFMKGLVKRKKWAFIADFVRLWALYNEGGIYLDTDVEVLKSFDQLLEDQAFVGFQKTVVEKGCVNNAVIGAQPENPFIMDCLKEFCHCYYYQLKPDIGPTNVSNVLMKWGLTEYGDQRLRGVRILPVKWFYPFSWTEEFTPECLTNETLSMHYWADTWRKKRSIKEKMVHLGLKMHRVLILSFRYLKGERRYQRFVKNLLVDGRDRDKRYRFIY